MNIQELQKQIINKGVVKMIDAEEVINKIKDDKYYTHEELTVVLNYIDKLKEENENLKKEIFELNKEMSDFSDQWLHKYKIREKIKKLENEFNFYAGRDPYEWDDSEFDGDRCDTLSQQIKVLKELLEGE